MIEKNDLQEKEGLQEFQSTRKGEAMGLSTVVVFVQESLLSKKLLTGMNYSIQLTQKAKN